MEENVDTEMAECQCGKKVPIDEIKHDANGLETCPECFESFEKEWNENEAKLKEIGWEHIFSKLEQYEGDWFADDIAKYLTQMK